MEREDRTMTEPLRVEPVEVEYYQDKDSSVARVVWYMALIAILFGGFHVLMAGLQLTGMALGIGLWRSAGAWYAVMMLGNGVLSVLLLLSGIGCMTQRQIGRKGILAYGYAAVVFHTFVMGAYVMTVVRNPAAMGFGSSMLDTMMIAVGYVSWMVQGCLFPVIVILVFRMKEVERLFVR
jgi:hypothetical protein